MLVVVGVQICVVVNNPKTCTHTHKPSGKCIERVQAARVIFSSLVNNECGSSAIFCSYTLLSLPFHFPFTRFFLHKPNLRRVTWQFKLSNSVCLNKVEKLSWWSLDSVAKTTCSGLLLANDYGGGDEDDDDVDDAMKKNTHTNWETKFDLADVKGKHKKNSNPPPHTRTHTPDTTVSVW